MCARRLALDISDPARRDLSDILLYSLDAWGEDLALDYQADLDHAFDTIRDQPQMGTPHPEIGHGVGTHTVRHHVILYRVMGRAIRVIRVLHERQVIPGEFDGLD